MSFSGKVVDWINPVVLRESRQLVRGRFAVGVLMAFMLIMVVASALYVMESGGRSRNMFSHGKNLFQILYLIMGFACVLFIPAYTAIPLMLQKQSTNMDLLMVSTIPPRSVVLGKMASAFWMMTLMFSVSMPFMSLTVLLRGIGMLEIIAYFILMACMVLIATMGFLLIACLPTSRVFASLMSIGYFLFLLIFPNMTMLFNRSGLTGEVVWIFVGFAAVLLPIGGALATAMISPTVSNRALGVRITVTVCWIVSGIVCALLSSSDALEVWCVCSVFGAALAILVSASEPAEMSRRVRRSVPRNKVARFFAFAWFTGPLNGWVWAMSIAMVSMSLLNGSSPDVEEIAPFALYALMYSLFGVFMRRLPLLRRIPERYTWALAVGLGLFGIFLPIIAHFIVHPEKRPDVLWRFGNPFAVFDNSDGHVGFTILMIIVLSALNLPWIFRQIASFHPAMVVEPATEEG